MTTYEYEPEKLEDPIVSTVKAVWATTPGKVVLVGIGILTTLGFGGLAFGAGSFFMKNYKDFTDQWRRP